MTRQLTTEPGADAPQLSDSTSVIVREWPDDAALSWTLNAVEGAEANDAIMAIVATGSSVRDVEYSDDLDLVLVYRECRPSMPRPPISIDLRRYEQDDVLRKLAEGHDYLSWTVRYGRALFERDTWWTRLRVDWNGRLSPPSAAEAYERARKAESLYRELRAIGDTSAATELHLSMLTHLARAALSDAHTFPKSRPEIAGQLREIGEQELADRLVCALELRHAQKTDDGVSQVAPDRGAST